MVEVSVLIPVVDNDGRPFTGEDHLAFEAVLVSHFGGFTLFPGEARGAWVDNGQTYVDATRIYVVFVDGILGRAASIGETVTFAKAHYRQLAITVRYLNMAEIL